MNDWLKNNEEIKKDSINIDTMFNSYSKEDNKQAETNVDDDPLSELSSKNDKDKVSDKTNGNQWKDIFSNFIQIIKEFKTNSSKDETFDKLTSMDKKREEKRKVVVKRALILLILVPLTLFILQILFKTTYILTSSQDETVITKKLPRKNIKLEINSFTRWQELKNKQVRIINKDISEFKADVKNDFNTTRVELKKDIVVMRNEVVSEIKNIVQISQEFTQKGLDKVTEQLSRNNEELTKRISKIDNKYDAKIRNLELNGLGSSTIQKQSNTPLLNLPPLPPIKNSKNFLNIKDKENMIPIEETEYEIVEEIIEDKKFTISTLPKEIELLDGPIKELPSFTLMPGFAQGIIVAGADVPTLKGKTSEAKPVWISINSETLTPNNEIMHMEDCLLQTTASGEFVSGRASLRLSKLSCTITDIDGNKYKIHQPVKGWIYGEEGKYGVKGRIVSKEGEIIKRGVSLAALEGIIGMLTKAGENANTITPTTTTDGTTSINPLGELTKSSSNVGNQIIQKFADYYLEILQSLNPYIEIKLKRKVTIAFEGGEVIKPTLYKTFDVNYFENEELEYEEY